MASKKEEVVQLKELKIEKLTLSLKGDSPLIAHAWDEKARREMLDKMMKKAKTVREAKNPVSDFINSLYWLSGKPEEMTEEAFESAVKNGARFGFPAKAFKAAAVCAGIRTGTTKYKVTMYAAFHIQGELVEIFGKPEPREDMVRLSGQNGPPDIRFRAQFPEWKAVMNLTYCPDMVSLEQIINLFNLGGYCCGVGEMRVEKGGEYGMFHIMTKGEV
jgi:hypothetical protein